MKRFFQFLMASALAVSMMGCTESPTSVEPEDSPTAVQLRLKGNIASLKPSTRVNADGFVTDDKVGVYVSSTGSFAPQKNTLDNVAYTYSSNSLDAPEGGEAYWGSKDVKLKVWAYYPYDPAITNNSAYEFAVATDQSDPAGFYGSDFILAVTDNLAPQEAPVQLTFNHKLSKVVLEFVCDGTTTDEDLKESITKVAINGLCVNGSIDLADGSVELGSTTATITPNKVSDLNYEAIVYPQEGTLSLRVQFGDDIYLYSTDVVYQAGYQYKYTLKVDLRKPMEMTLKAVKISDWEDGEGAEGVMSDIISFTDAKFKEYLLGETLWVSDGDSYVASGKIDANNDGEISIAEAEKVEKIDIDRTRCGLEITDLGELHYFVNLKSLNCTTQKLNHLDVSKNTSLTELDCGDNCLTTLDVSMLTKLKLLRCGYNQLTELVVGVNTKLMHLECNANILTSLEVSNNTELNVLYCHDNQLTSLDVSKNTALEELLCQDNQLTSLDVSKNTKLRNLCCDQNQLETLDVSNNPKLGHLDCGKNDLTALDLSKNIELYDLSCSDNQLSVLDLSYNPQLGRLICVQKNDDEGKNMLKTIYLAEGVTIESLDVVDIPEGVEIKYNGENKE